jgi:hydroxylamine reductase
MMLSNAMILRSAQVLRGSVASYGPRCLASYTAGASLSFRVGPNLDGNTRTFATKPTSTPHQHFSTASAVKEQATHVTQAEMFCRQCEQTKDGVACTTLGICGKTPETAAIQDTLMEVIKCVSLWAVAARKAGAAAEDMKPANEWSLRAAFSTLTNVNFSENRIAEYIHQGMAVKQSLAIMVQNKNGDMPEASNDTASLELSSSMNAEELEEFGRLVGVLENQKKMDNVDAFSLNEIGTYGAKGVSAYACHAFEMGYTDEEGIMAPLHEVWAKLASHDADVEGLLANALRVGEINATTMALLDSSHCEKFGTPEPTEVRMTAVEGKANILVSGHDMVDLNALLEQTKDKGVNVYTHGEMLPAHMYPKLKAYGHLVGNYGTAWQAQKFEFATFPGPVVVTTNCIVAPRKKYKNRIYTTNEVGVDGVQHIEGRDFSKVIEQALQEPVGFKRTVKPLRYHTVGFNHRVVLPLADQVIEAVQQGHLSRIFLIGGCDGSEWDRSYFTDLAEATPDDSLILTMGCAKNRIMHSPKLMDAKLANGMPRVMDMGQCNDSYSAVVVALELAKALDCSVNELPLSLAISHLEQKAAAVFLTLLHLGVKNIRLGPRLPAYVTPNILKVLQDNYNLMPTGNMEDDLAAMMEGK